MSLISLAGRSLALVLLFAAPAAAQPALFPDGTAPPVAALPHWRIATTGGLTADALVAVASASVERSWRGPASLGGRAWTTAGRGFVDDGPSMSGGGGEAFVAVGTRDRWLDLRASAGLGLAVLDYSVGGIGCESEFEVCSEDPESFSGIRPYALAGLGLDVYVLPGVGLGGEVRAALVEGPANISTVEFGLRVRLAR